MTLQKATRRVASLQGEALLRSVDVLNNQLGSRASATFVRNISRVSRSQEVADILKEIRAGRGLSQATHELIDHIDLDIDTLHDLYGDAYLKGGKAAQRVYSDVVLFDPRNPRVLEHVMTTGLTRITEINTATRDAYRQMIFDGISDGVEPRVIADSIHSQLGLTYRQSQAVSKMRNRLFDEGVPIRRANRQASDYAQNLLRQRADTIAETEMAYALEQGKIEYWTQAQQGGLLGRDEVLVWVVEQDDRVDEPCESREGMEIPLREFHNSVIDSPPIHPRCRCQWILGSGKTQSNRATTPTDRRLTGGQTVNRFVNPTSGHVMGKTETGDVYEAALFLGRGKAIAEKHFGGRLISKTGRTRGGPVNAPVDFEILPYDGGKPWAVEVKSMHQLSNNKKTAIKAPEYARKIAYVLDTDDARAIVGAMDDKIDESVRAAQAALDDMVDAIGGLENAPKRPAILVQVVDDSAMAASAGADDVAIKLYSYKGDFPSRRLSAFDEFGGYSLPTSTLEEAAALQGHAGIKIPQRALKQVLDGIDGMLDDAWHPMNARDGQINKPLSYILDSLDPDSPLKPIWNMTRQEVDDLGLGFGTTPRTAVTAEARPLDGIINFGDDFWDLTVAQRKQVVLHEAGHSLEHRIMGDLRLRQAWEVLPKEAKSGYNLGVRSDAESLAEAFSRLWVDQAAFKKNLPQAYRFTSAMSDAFDFPIPTKAPGFNPRLRKRRTARAWICGTTATRVPDQWNEEAVDGEWYIEITNRGLRLVPFLVDAKQAPEVEWKPHELHF